jgi:shikimate dehydrogenase
MAAASVEKALEGATLVVNATPVGLRGDDLPFDPGLVPRNAILLDLVYRPGETELVRRARALGIRASDGREMLLEQGVLAFMQWFGYAPNKTVMRRALEDAIMRA